MTAWDILNGLGVFAGVAVGSFVTYMRNHGQSNRSPLQQETSQNSEVDELVTRALIEFGAIRAYVSEYVDNGLGQDGKPIKIKNRTHERVADGVNYQAVEFQHIPMSTLAEETALVLQAGPSFTLVNDLPDCRFKWICRAGNTNAVARVGLYRKGSPDPYGFVGLDFRVPVGQIPVVPPNIEVLCEYAGRIENIMSQK